jgi:hypothetical protein
MDVPDWSESSRNNTAMKKRKGNSGSSSKTGDEVESNYQDDEDTPAPTPNTEEAEDDNMDMNVQDNVSNVNTSGSFCSNAPSHDCDTIPQGPTRGHHNHEFRNITSNIHGFSVAPPVNQPALRMNHLDHSMSFRMPHGLPGDVHFEHPSWSVAPSAGGELAPSYNGEGMMMVSAPLMDHAQFGGSIAIRPRDSRDVHGMIPPGTLNGGPQYPYYQIANHDGPPHRSATQRVDDSNMFYDVYR